MTTDRSDLTSRVIPRMEFSDGSASSLTAPPPPIANVDPAKRAAYRFEVTGNAIVTGGGGGLGLSACGALLEHGLQGLVIFDLHPEEAQPRVEALRATHPGSKIEFLAVNVTDHAAVQAATEKAEALLGGPISVLVCFAGIVDTAHALEMKPEAWRRVMDVNTTGSYLCAQAAAKSMVRGGRGGSIVLIASMSGSVVNFPQPQIAYNASKAAVISLKSSLAAEWGRYGIRVNSISPGYMNTILNEGTGVEELHKIWFERSPMGRLGEPDEVTGVVVLLAGRAGSYITGADIKIDGGITVF